MPSVGSGNALINVVTLGAFGRQVQVAFQNAKSGSLLPRVSINTTGLVRTGGTNITPAQQQNAIPGQTINEQQLIRITGLNSGTWRISYGGEVSGPLSYSISDADLKQVLDGFASIDNSFVLSYFSQGSKFIQIEFGGTQAGLNMVPIQLDTANLIGGSVTGPARTITTNYNASSEVTSVVDPNSTVSFTRDNMGRATTIATTIATLSQSVSLNQVFDAASNRTELRATVGSTPDFKNNYTYDKLRRLTDVVQTGQAGGNPVVSKHIAQSFNAASQRTNITRYQSAGTTNLVASTIFTYDTAGRLSGIGHTKGATNLNTYAYTYDPLSRLSSVTSTAEGTTNYSYFNDSQLKSASGSRPTESYTYDTNGNRTMAGYSTIADNRTTADASFTYTYDAEGNLTRKTNKSTRQVVATYEWDHRNRLTKVNGGVTGPGGIEYEYDAFNRLVRRRAFDPNVPNQYWVYDEGINPVLQFDTGGNAGVGGISHRYIWSDYVDDLLSDEQISFPSNTVNTLWPLADHLGSIRDIADFNEATGITAIANHRTYDSFGKLVDETGTASIPFGYTGKLFDKTTGLQNNLNRWYDPNLGKWISQDPIGFAAGDANLYRYVGNGPTNATDPSGLEDPSLKITVKGPESYFENGGQWWITNANIHYAGHYGETMAGNVNTGKWYDEFWDGPFANLLAAGSIHLFRFSGNATLKDQIVYGDKKIKVDVEIGIEFDIQFKAYNKLSMMSSAAWLLGIKVPGLVAASRYQLGEGLLRSFLSSTEVWKKIRDAADKTNSLNALYPLIDKDSLMLEVSPSVVCASGIDAVNLRVSGLDLGTQLLGYGTRREGTSNAMPWKSPWTDGIWNSDYNFPLIDFPVTPKGKTK